MVAAPRPALYQYQPPGCMWLFAQSKNSEAWLKASCGSLAKGDLRLKAA
jgi:hypothetical protein